MKNLLLMIGLCLFTETFAQIKIENEHEKFPIAEKPSETLNKGLVNKISIYDKVEQLAEFPGGITAFRNKFVLKFNYKKINESKVFIEQR